MRPDLDPEQLDRYSRHIIMDDVGPDGQKALLDADVLVLGFALLGVFFSGVSLGDEAGKMIAARIRGRIRTASTC